MIWSFWLSITYTQILERSDDRLFDYFGIDSQPPKGMLKNRFSENNNKIISDTFVIISFLVRNCLQISILKELRNRILCTILVWPLFCLIQFYGFFEKTSFSSFCGFFESRH